MYKYNNNILPKSFNGLFINHQSTHNYNTRNKDDYQFHMFRVNTVLNTGPKIWNNLPKHIKCSKTLGQFKREKMCPILTHEYPSCTFGVENWLLTFHIVKTNHQI